MDLVRNNPILSVVRSTVSQDRTRFKDHDSNLDLTYITDNLIAMGFPASGLESAWRNHIDEVANMLHRYHGLNNILIFNLSDRKYDYEKFRNQIVEFGFPDHYSPPLDVLFQIVLAVDNWIKSSPKHVAVVHCMGGKGRTGTVIVCWLMLVGLAENARAAFEFFAAKRSKITKGVTQASQKRYVAYFEDICRKRKPPKPKRFILQRIEISPVPQFGKKRPGCKPRVEVCSTRVYPESMLWNNPFVRYHDQSEGKIVMDLGIKIMGDTLIRCVHMSKSGERLKVFRIAFHTAFVVAGAAKLVRDDLDDIKKVKSGGKDKHGLDFSVTLFFVDDPLEEREIELELRNDIPALYQKLWGDTGMMKPVAEGQNTPLLHTEPDLPSSIGNSSSPASASPILRASQQGDQEAKQAAVGSLLHNVPLSRSALMSVNLSPKWDVSSFTIPTTKDKDAAAAAGTSTLSRSATSATLRNQRPSPLGQSQQNPSSSVPPSPSSPMRSPRSADSGPVPQMQSNSPTASSSNFSSASPRNSPARTPASNNALIGASPARVRGSNPGTADVPESSSNRLLLNLLHPTPSPSPPASPKTSAEDNRDRRRSVRDQIDTMNRTSGDRKNSGPPTPASRTPQGNSSGMLLRESHSNKPIPSPPSRTSVATSASADEVQTRERAGSVAKKLPPTPGTLRRETPSKPPKPQFDVSITSVSPSSLVSQGSPQQPQSSPRQGGGSKSPRGTPLPPIPTHKRSPSSGAVLVNNRVSAQGAGGPLGVPPTSSPPVPAWDAQVMMSAPLGVSPLDADRPTQTSRFLLADL